MENEMKRLLIMIPIIAVVFTVTAYAQGGVPPVPTDMIATVILSLLGMGLGWLGTKIPDRIFDNKWIPIAVALGTALLGLFDYYALGGWATSLAGDNAWLAGIIGAVAGMVSVWLHQVFKQQTK